MKELKGALLLGQSGGPTAVINATAAGVFEEALKSKNVERVLGAKHGVWGISNEEFFDINLESKEDLANLKYTPSSQIGSIRYKLKDLDKDPTDYERILEVFKKYNIRYFLYNGGNDSMDSANKIAKFFKDHEYECYIIGVPKTIDNDLPLIDFCPGYGSAAKYIGTTLSEIYLDAHVYNIKQITVVEIMGRNAGWLTAAAFLASKAGFGPDLVYLPEVPFDIDKVLKEIEEKLKNKKTLLVCVSEGLKTPEGEYVIGALQKLRKDSFGHSQLGGVAKYIADTIGERLNIKSRPIELSTLQRCAAHVASKTDIDVAYKVGQHAVKLALAKNTDVMAGYKRISNNPFKLEYTSFPLEAVANVEHKIPLKWISKTNDTISQEFFDYVYPLIQGETGLKYENGLPKFTKLKKILYKK